LVSGVACLQFHSLPSLPFPSEVWPVPPPVALVKNLVMLYVSLVHCECVVELRTSWWPPQWVLHFSVFVSDCKHCVALRSRIEFTFTYVDLRVLSWVCGVQYMKLHIRTHLIAHIRIHVRTHMCMHAYVPMWVVSEDFRPQCSSEDHSGYSLPFPFFPDYQRIFDLGIVIIHTNGIGRQRSTHRQKL
jgi:hypothetical protein